MRPGRMPRKYLAHVTPGNIGGPASMRPGRMPRKYQPRPSGVGRRPNGFNEAGADAPEIPPALPWMSIASRALQ